jgi:hypothetical protein
MGDRIVSADLTLEAISESSYFGLLRLIQVADSPDRAEQRSLEEMMRWFASI